MKIPVIYGPTGVGKTDFLLSLSGGFPIEIISMDSMQIYRLMDIGTAKPTINQRESLKHWMIDIIDPTEEYNAYRYREEVLRIIPEILARGKIPVLAGGTGLYLDTLLNGLFDGVAKDENVRRDLRKREENEPGVLRSWLQSVDQESFERIHPNDIKRTIRALEVYVTTGKTLSEQRTCRSPDNRFFIFELTRGREDLYKIIDQRVDKMVEEGLTEETVKLLSLGCKADSQSMKAIGYRETIRYLRNEITSREQYIHQLKTNTHHYARRQIIWGRKYNSKSTLSLSEESLEYSKQKFASFIESYTKML
jgi:tRNA dimethylallyltransferase